MEKGNQKNSEHIIVICAYCKKSLQGQELWENDFEKSSGISTARVSHGICPDCLLENFPNEYLVIQEEKKVRIKKLFERGYRTLYGHLAK